MSARLATGFWVRALLRRFAADGSSAMVLKKGDEDAGSVLIVLRDRHGGEAVLREEGGKEGPGWIRADPGSGPGALEDYLERQRRYDPDLWLVEIEVPDAAAPVERVIGSRRAE